MTGNRKRSEIQVTGERSTQRDNRQLLTGFGKQQIRQSQITNDTRLQFQSVASLNLYRVLYRSFFFYEIGLLFCKPEKGSAVSGGQNFPPRLSANGGLEKVHPGRTVTSDFRCYLFRDKASEFQEKKDKAGESESYKDKHTATALPHNLST